MRKTLHKLIGITVTATLAGALLIAAPAHAATTCTGFLGSNPVTVGVLGEDLASTPEAHVEVCVGADATTGQVPMLRVETCCPNSTYQIVWLDQPTDGGAPFVVSLRYSVDGSGSTVTVPLPVPSDPGGSTCIFYRGRASSNPGGCVLYVES